MFACLLLIPFHCGTCLQEEFAEPVKFGASNKRFKSKRVKGMYNCKSVIE